MIIGQDVLWLTLNNRVAFFFFFPEPFAFFLFCNIPKTISSNDLIAKKWHLFFIDIVKLSVFGCKLNSIIEAFIFEIIGFNIGFSVHIENTTFNEQTFCAYHSSWSVFSPEWPFVYVLRTWAAPSVRAEEWFKFEITN